MVQSPPASILTIPALLATENPRTQRYMQRPPRVCPRQYHVFGYPSAHGYCMSVTCLIAGSRWLSLAHFDRRQDQPWRNCREGTNPLDLAAPAAETVRAHALHYLFPPTTYPDAGHALHAHLHGLHVYHYGPTSTRTTV